MNRRSGGVRASACLIVVFALLGAACGGGSSKGASGNPSSGTTAPSKPCPGQPMKFTEMALAASGRLVTNSTFFEIAPAGGAAAGALGDADAAATTPVTSVRT